MGWEENRLTVNDWGVHVGGDPPDPDAPPWRSFAWDDIREVCAYAVRDREGTFTVYQLHHDDTWEEVLSFWAGFPALASGITAKLPGISATWLSNAGSLRVGEGTVVIWRRDGTAGGGTAVA